MSLKMKFDGLRRFLVPSLPHAVKTPKTNELVTFLGELAEKVDQLDSQVPRVLSVEVSGLATVADTEDITLTAAVVTQGGADDTVVWSSSAPLVASVVEATGVVTGEAVGEAVITATSVFDPSISDSLTVEVTA